MGGVWRTPKLRCLRAHKAEETPRNDAEGTISDEEFDALMGAAFRRGLKSYEAALDRRIAALTRAKRPEEPSAQAPGALTEGELLRKQCLEWGFQRRDLMKVPHMEVVNVAREYYDFIRNTQARQDRVAYGLDRDSGGD